MTTQFDILGFADYCIKVAVAGRTIWQIESRKDVKANLSKVLEEAGMPDTAAQRGAVIKVQEHEGLSGPETAEFLAELLRGFEELKKISRK